MRLKVLSPTTVLLDAQVDKVAAEALSGQFCLLPRHVDFVAPLGPGVLAFERAGQQAHFVGIDEGVLVKVGDEVLVSVRQAIRSEGLEELEQRVENEFRVLDEHERRARSATARLEAGLVRRFLDVQEQMTP